jgi:hypothetical protein
MKGLILALSLTGLVAAGVSAIDQLDGFPQPQGLHWNYYPHFYTADNVNDKDGHLLMDGFGISLYEMLVRPVYIHGDWLYNAIIPIGDLNMNRLGCYDHEYDARSGRDSLNDFGPTYVESSSGVGDIILGAGKFQKLGDWHWLPYVSVKLASGPYEMDMDGQGGGGANYNYGSGQVDATFENYFNHCGKWSVDGLIKYRHRFKNHDTGFKPGDQVGLEFLLSYGCGEMMGFWHKDMWGLCVEYMTSTKAEYMGNEVEGSQITKLSVGPEVYHGISQRSHFWFAIKHDVIAENAPKGTLFWIKYTLF